MAEIQLPDGNMAKIPDFALESTQSKMHDLISAMVASNKKAQAALEKINKNAIDALDKDKDVAADALREQQKQTKLLQEQTKENQNFRSVLSSRIEADMTSMFTGTGNVLTGLAKGAVMASAALGGFLVKSFMDAGNSLRQLTTVGLGSVGLTADITQFTRLGMSAGQAAEYLSRFSNSAAVLGRTNFSKFTTNMAESAALSGELGLTFEESLDVIGEEIDIRRMGSTQRLNLDLQERNAIQERIQQTFALSAVTGKSMREIANSSRDFFKSNATVASALLRLPADAAKRVRDGLDVGIRVGASVGDELEDVIKMIFQGASAMIPGATREFQDITRIPAIADLGRDLIDINQLISKGSFGAAEAQTRVISISKRLANLTEDQRISLEQQRAFGNETAATVLNAAILLQSAGEDVFAKMMALSTSIDPTVKAVTDAQNAFSKFKGIFSTIFFKSIVSLTDIMEEFVKQVGKSGGVIDKLSQAVNRIFNAILTVFGSDLKAGSKAATDMASSLANLGTWIEETSIELEKWLLGLEGETLGEKLADAAKKIFDKALPGIVYALTETTKGVIVGLFSSPEVIGALVLGISTLFTGRLAVSALASALSGLGARIMSMIFGGAAAATPAVAATPAAAGAASAASRLLPALSGFMIGKDVYDVATAEPGKAKQEDVMGVGAGAIGALMGGLVGSAFAGVGAIPGAAIGAGIGNVVGNLFGSYIDDKKVSESVNAEVTEAVNAEVTEAAKEELKQQQGLFAMAIDPEHVAKVTGALRVFSQLNLTPVIGMFVGGHIAITDFISAIESVRVNSAQSMQLFLNNAKNFETAGILTLTSAMTGINEAVGLFISLTEMMPTAGNKLATVVNGMAALPYVALQGLGNAILILAKGIQQFASATSMNAFERMASSFSKDTTAEFVKNLNSFANDVDSTKLMQTAQAVVAMNAAKAGATQMPVAQPTTMITPGTEAASAATPMPLQNTSLTQTMANMNSTLIQLSTQVAIITDQMRYLRQLDKIEENTR